MTKKSNVSLIRRQQHAKAKSKMSELKRVEEIATAPGAVQRTSIAQGVASLKHQLNNDHKQGLVRSVTWQPLMNLYDSIAKGIYEFSLAIYDNQQIVSQAGRADAKFNDLVITAINDSKIYADQVVQIKNKHADRVGIVTGPDLDLYYQIGEE